MIRVSMFHRNGFEDHLKTTEKDAMDVISAFSEKDSIWIDRYEWNGGTFPSVASHRVDFSSVITIEFGRIDD